MNSFLNRYFLKEGWRASAGLLILRLAIGTMMIHHGYEKLADPANFAAAYVEPLHLPFPILMANVAGLSEVIGSWFLILGFLSPIGALALVGTMSVAGYHHILTSGFNIYLMELVVLYFGGSLAILLMGPGRISFDAGIVTGLLQTDVEQESFFSSTTGQPIPVEVSDRQAASRPTAGRR
ncbi:DoxX family protein [Synechococcus sp. CS-602]|uniref:DoxX family protein n=1 Tax=Synechococcaceae TaxID=1890426 RepID=UPI0009F8A55A|nr:MULTISPECIES: DoxX family protein [Synechococcaceae]MCT4363852.1 DoxX family protein [Candidatus Regnicoccus frigidus MAG-AL1]MCT0201646.1 DoxX family protein [Synechococcus sp. CS-603]MCT0203513.1 DoxX family protein [Synechococcus sp. CS-602]MCT0246263.1 DoxX family protein [Synechococcus sp. CS-601]MCT4366105.1 DoxX family protein [Candidatus Regnicoccus frigidus MAG-AL2]